MISGYYLIVLHIVAHGIYIQNNRLQRHHWYKHVKVLPSMTTFSIQNKAEQHNEANITQHPHHFEAFTRKILCENELLKHAESGLKPSHTIEYVLYTFTVKYTSQT